jgi:asparagine synthase (glutamine-hydrolysing)
MCGICGFNSDNKELIRKMASVIEHRGPDNFGFYLDKNVSLGHRRLSIIDLSEKGKQPIFNEDKSICVIYNGEIYNFNSIRDELEKRGHRFYSNTDTEVIVHAYEEYGENCISIFNGMFAFAIYDIDKKKLFIARDRLGIKPLYYYFKNGKFAFASEIKAILEDKEIKRKVNLDALNKFITLRYIPEGNTIFKNIHRLLAGHYITYDLCKNNLKISKYWDISIDDANILHKPESFFAKRIRDLLADSVKKRLISDVPLGVYLSGGLDSSSVVAMMRHINPSSTIKTFSVGFEHDIIGNELKYAKLVSEYFNTDHKEFVIKADVIKLLPKIVWHLDEPMSDPATIPNYVLSENAKKYVTVILTGDGGDDIFAGYDQHKFPVVINNMRHVPSIIKKKAMPLILRMTPKVVLDRIYKYSSATGEKIFERFSKFVSCIDANKAKSYLEIISVFDEDERGKLFKKNIKTKIKEFCLHDRINFNYFRKKQNFLNQLLYMEIKRYLPEDLLMKPDKMCMAYGIEARVPFLDHILVEFSFKIPPELKLKKLTAKYILKKSLSNMLPKEILQRKKQTFQLPIDQWIEKDLKPTFKELLSKEDIEKQGYFNYRFIEKIFKNYKKSKLFYGRQLWSLLTFQLWYKIYIEEENLNKVMI